MRKMMRKMMKSGICSMIAVSMMMAILAGCGKADDENVSNFENGSGNEVGDVENSASADNSESDAAVPTVTPEPTPEPTIDPAIAEQERAAALSAERTKNAEEKLEAIINCYYSTLDGTNVNSYFVQRVGYSYTTDKYNQKFDNSKYDAFDKNGREMTNWLSALIMPNIYYEHYVNMNEKDFSLWDLTIQYEDEDAFTDDMSEYDYRLENSMFEGIVGFAPMFAKHEVTLLDPENAQVTFGNESKNKTSDYRVGFLVDGENYGFSMYFTENGDLIGIKHEGMNKFFYEFEEGGVIHNIIDAGVWEVYEWTVKNTTGVPDFSD